MRLLTAGVAHDHGTGTLFTGVDLICEPGALTCVHGPSGSGKSTLLAILGRVLPPTAGIVTWDGIGEARWIFQYPVGVPHRTVVDQVAFPLLMRGDEPSTAEARAREILSTVGLADRADALFRTLSGGEAMRVMLARALAADVDLLLVDEPTAQLDRASAARVTTALRTLASAGRIVVIASHDPLVVEVADRRIDLAEHAPAPTRGAGR